MYGDVTLKLSRKGFSEESCNIVNIRIMNSSAKQMRIVKHIPIFQD